MENFDLKAYLRNNKLLNEGIEEIEETVEEASCGSKMKRSELKEKIREEILEALSETDSAVVADEQEGESVVAEQDEEEDEIGADIDIDADVDIEDEPSFDEPTDDIGGGDVSSTYSEIMGLAKDGQEKAMAVNDSGLAKNFNDIQKSVASKTVQTPEM